MPEEEVPPRPSRQAIAEHVRRALGPNGTVIPTLHLTQRLAERGRDMQDVLKVLETGQIGRAETTRATTVSMVRGRVASMAATLKAGASAS